MGPDVSLNRRAQGLRDGRSRSINLHIPLNETLLLNRSIVPIVHSDRPFRITLRYPLPAQPPRTWESQRVRSITKFQ